MKDEITKLLFKCEENANPNLSTVDVITIAEGTSNTDSFEQL